MNKSFKYILDFIIPGSSKCDFRKHIEDSKERDLLISILNEVDIFIKESLDENSFGNDVEIINQAIKKYNRKNFRKFNLLSVVLAECYYSDSEVRQSLGVPMKLPFPNGNYLPEIDLNLLETVYNRGSIYRKF